MIEIASGLVYKGLEKIMNFQQNLNLPDRKFDPNPVCSCP